MLYAIRREKYSERNSPSSIELRRSSSGPPSPSSLSLLCLWSLHRRVNSFFADDRRQRAKLVWRFSDVLRSFFPTPSESSLPQSRRHDAFRTLVGVGPSDDAAAALLGAASAASAPWSGRREV